MKKLLIAVGIIFFVVGAVYADKIVTFDGYDPISVSTRFANIDYGDENGGVKSTFIYRVKIRATATGDPNIRQTYEKFYDYRANNPNGYERLPFECRNGTWNPAQCNLRLFRALANEALSIDVAPELQ